MEGFCNKMAPNTATHSTIAGGDPSAARRMPDFLWGGMDGVFYPNLSGQFVGGATAPVATANTPRDTAYRREAWARYNPTPGIAVCCARPRAAKRLPRP